MEIDVEEIKTNVTNEKQKNKCTLRRRCARHCFQMLEKQ